MLTTEAGSTGLAGRLVDTADATGRVFDPPRFLRFPPGVAVVGPAAWKPVVLSRPSFQQLFGAVRFIAHVPFRAVIPGRIAMAIGDGFPPRIDDRHEPKDTPLIGCMVDAVVPQVRVADGVDGTAPAVEQITQALLICAASQISSRISASRFFFAASRCSCSSAAPSCCRSARRTHRRSFLALLSSLSLTRSTKGSSALPFLKLIQYPPTKKAP